MRNVVLALCLLPLSLSAVADPETAVIAGEPEAMATASAAAPTDEPIPAASLSSLETVVVTGTQPGPGLWKLTRDGHVLWLLGTVAPLPRDMTWKADDVKEAIAASDAVLKAPSASIDADVGFFGRIALLPSLVKIRNNPDGEKLQEVVPADLYARWLPLKAKYLGDERKVEKWRPLFAAMELYDAALKKNRLTMSGQIKPVLETAIKARGIKPTETAVAIKVDDARGAIKEFKAQGINDIDCLRKTIDRLETDLGRMRSRANAWATGDIDTLRALPHEDVLRQCFEAVTATAFGQHRGLDDLPRRIENAWLDAADAALKDSPVSFGTLSINELLQVDGLLAKLQARGGGEVETP